MSEEAEQYITKIVVEATQMTLADFYNSRGQPAVSGWGGRKGYIVRRVDNRYVQDNNEMWVSDGEFNLNYTPIVAMDFGSAFKYLEDGSRLARSRWGDEKFIFRAFGTTKKATRRSRWGSIPRGELIPMLSHVCMWADGHAVPWLPSYDDMFSRDWRIIRLGE